MLTGSRPINLPFSRTVTATPVQHFVIWPGPPLEHVSRCAAIPHRRLLNNFAVELSVQTRQREESACCRGRQSSFDSIFAHQLQLPPLSYASYISLQGITVPQRAFLGDKFSYDVLLEYVALLLA